MLGYTALAGGGLTAALYLQQFDERWIAKPDLLPAPDRITLKPFEFKVVTVNAHGEVIKQVAEQAKFFAHDFGNSINLEMVAIPGGKFLMGTEDSELEKIVEKYSHVDLKWESPQHEVTFQPFFMSKYLVTQAQWRAVAGLPKVSRNLRQNPSDFKGDNLPVETISWEEATEFCQRLSKLIIGYTYRLPSEAEWEYAARAGTTTPFHFGETITGNLANYRASETYGAEPKGEYRGKTIPVGSFPPNAFGLYDMHGNLWEWCEDDWHISYDGAPTDGSAWTKSKNITKVLRGGSWGLNPNNCRSAYRYGRFRFNRSNDIGFRVVCSASRT